MPYALRHIHQIHCLQPIRLCFLHIVCSCSNEHFISLKPSISAPESISLSAFAIRLPVFMPSRISSLALRMFSLEPRFSIWVMPTFVIIAASGAAILVRANFSAVIHAHFDDCGIVTGSMLNRVAGTPTSLFRFP